jgi:hypothetical protein
MGLITFENDEKEIIATNYYQTELNTHNKFYVSLNAGAFRLLIPETLTEKIIYELNLSKKILIFRKKLSFGLIGFQILLDDGSSNPFIFEFTENSFDRLPIREDSGRKFTFLAYGKKKETIQKVYKSFCYYKDER